jgi:tripartite-type tricarboxylate transporter receptor subunit TctC
MRVSSGKSLRLPHFDYGTVNTIGRDRMKLPRRNFLHLAALPVVPRIAWAQAYPSRPVRLIVPVAAGGSTDVAARTIAEHLSRSFAHQIYVENRGGAGGIIGIETARKKHTGWLHRSRVD